MQLPLVRRLPADLQLQLKAHMQVFLAEKPMLGCQGLDLTDAMRIAIAAQACLLLLNRQTDYYPNLRQILVYPGPFVVNRQQPVGSGVMQDLRQVLSGESWSQGQVVLSWQDVQVDSADGNDGRNVVIHEFAHQLDQESGQANGAPTLAFTRRLPRLVAGLRSGDLRICNNAWLPARVDCSATMARPIRANFLRWPRRCSSSSRSSWPTSSRTCSRNCATSMPSTR